MLANWLEIKTKLRNQFYHLYIKKRIKNWKKTFRQKKSTKKISQVKLYIIENAWTFSNGDSNFHFEWNFFLEIKFYQNFTLCLTILSIKIFLFKNYC